jgi:unsaturated rhamnogalacturonyl hydrolase
MQDIVETLAWQQVRNEKWYQHRWYYIEGLILKGYQDIDAARGEARYSEYVKEYVDSLFDADGTMRGYDPGEYNIDQINMGKILFDLYTRDGDPRYRTLMDALYGQLLTHPRTLEGNFWHKQIYPYQVWLDGLYMGQPFLVRYRKEILGDADFSDTVHQFENVRRHMYDVDRRLFLHAYDESRTMFWADPRTGLSLNVWGRACGWHVMALVDVLELMEGGSTDTSSVRSQLFEALEGLLEYQDEGGMWYQVVDRGNRKRNYLEPSGTLMIAYALLKAARLGYLPGSYVDAGRRAYEGCIASCVRELGGEALLEGTCRSAGLGGETRRPGTFDYYMEEPRGTNNGHGIGALLLARSEMLRLGL